MALINLQTNLKTLRWGNDQPNGGDSGLPYIKTSLPENSTAIERIALESAKFSSDYPSRGGMYAIRAAAEDAIRIRKFLTDFPKGSLFTQKQVGLQKSNPLIETGKNGGRINTRTYNLNSNLLFSTLMSDTGAYYPRAGATPFTLLDDNAKYAKIVGNKPKDKNKLVNLYKSKILNEVVDSTTLFELGISTDEFQILNYDGGPGSLYGDGETTHFKSTDYKGLSINTNNRDEVTVSKEIPQPTQKLLGDNKFKLNRDISSFLVRYNPKKSIEELLGIDGNGNIPQPVNNTFNLTSNSVPYSKIKDKERYIIGTSIKDFRSEIDPSGSVFSRDYSDYKVFRERRVGLGSPGSRPKELRTSTNIIYEPGQDKVNLTPIYWGNYVDQFEKTKQDTRDLIKFAFETIDNDNPSKTYRSHFRAHLKGFSDNNSAEWDGKRYAGRGDNMYNYQGFDRSISYSFTVLAQSKQEMTPLWQKLNWLNSTLQPDYDDSTGFMRGNIHLITVGEYLYRVPGILTSLNFSINDNYSWEIKVDEPEMGRDDDMMELPHAIDVSISFKPIYNELPRTVTNKHWKQGSLISKNIGITENFINKEKNYIKNL